MNEIHKKKVFTYLCSTLNNEHDKVLHRFTQKVWTKVSGSSKNPCKTNDWRSFDKRGN